MNVYNNDNGTINNDIYRVLKQVNEFERNGGKEILFVSPDDNRIFAFIDRGNNFRRRTRSEESDLVSDEEAEGENSLAALSEVSSIQEYEETSLEDSVDLNPIDLSILFEAARHVTTV